MLEVNPLWYFFSLFLICYDSWKKRTPPSVIHLIICTAAPNFKHFYTVMSNADPKIEFLSVIGSSGFFHVCFPLIKFIGFDDILLKVQNCSLLKLQFSFLILLFMLFCFLDKHMLQKLCFFQDSQYNSIIYSCEQCEYAATRLSGLKMYEEYKPEGIRFPCD